MKIFVLPLLVLYLVSTTLGYTCFQNFDQLTATTVQPNEAVGQLVNGSYITQNTFVGASLLRADSNPIAGTFYLIHGQSTNTSNAIFSTPFYSTSTTVYANGTVYILIGHSYTFLWVRDSSGNASDVWQSGPWLSNSLAYVGGAFTDPDNAGQYCFSTTPDNHQPSHTVYGTSFNQTNVTQILTGQVAVMANKGARGINLALTTDDVDTAINLGNVTYNLTVSTVSSTGVTASLVANQVDVQNVEILTWSQVTILIRGPLFWVQDAISRFGVKWGSLSSGGGTCTFRIHVTVNDNGNSGLCPGSATEGCPLWTSSRTEFKAS